MREHNIRHFGFAMPVLSVLFCHGKESIKWNKTLQEEDFSENLLKIPIEFRKIMLNYGIKILDAKSPKIQKACKNLKSRAVIKLLSEIWSIKKPNPEKVKDIFVEFKALLKKAKGQERKDTVLKILEYLTDNTGLDLKTWKKAEELIVEEGILTKGGIMDIREHIKEKGRWEGRQEGIKEGMQQGMQKGMQEGMQQGMQKGMQQVALNMLGKKTKISYISEITGLSKEEIKQLKNGS